MVTAPSVIVYTDCTWDGNPHVQSTPCADMPHMIGILVSTLGPLYRPATITTR
jgi:hypothetical protein